MAKSRRSKSSKTDTTGGAIEITPRLLRSWPLPQPDSDGDKSDRGRVVIVGGASGMPGTMVLAATAALRAGAGKVQIATGRSIMIPIGMAVLEARVFPLPETAAGALALAGADRIIERAGNADALLIGPGMIGEKAVIRLVEKIVPRIHRPVLLLDAAALDTLTNRRNLLAHLSGRAIITPHEGEMKRILDLDMEAAIEDRAACALESAANLHCVVVLKGSETLIATPEGKLYSNTAGNSGLAISGSGDTLSGIIAGLAARGAEPAQAAVWGVYLHARAGEILAEQMGPLGYLPRELLKELPRLMKELSIYD